MKRIQITSTLIKDTNYSILEFKTKDDLDFFMGDIEPVLGRRDWIKDSQHETLHVLTDLTTLISVCENEKCGCRINSDIYLCKKDLTEREKIILLTEELKKKDDKFNTIIDLITIIVERHYFDLGFDETWVEELGDLCREMNHPLDHCDTIEISLFGAQKFQDKRIRSLISQTPIYLSMLSKIVSSYGWSNIPINMDDLEVLFSSVQTQEDMLDLQFIEKKVFGHNCWSTEKLRKKKIADILSSKDIDLVQLRDLIVDSSSLTPEQIKFVFDNHVTLNNLDLFVEIETKIIGNQRLSKKFEIDKILSFFDPRNFKEIIVQLHSLVMSWNGEQDDFKVDNDRFSQLCQKSMSSEEKYFDLWIEIEKKLFNGKTPIFDSVIEDLNNIDSIDKLDHKIQTLQLKCLKTLDLKKFIPLVGNKREDRKRYIDIIFYIHGCQGLIQNIEMIDPDYAMRKILLNSTKELIEENEEFFDKSYAQFELSHSIIQLLIETEYRLFGKRTISTKHEEQFNVLDAALKHENIDQEEFEHLIKSIYKIKFSCFTFISNLIEDLKEERFAMFAMFSSKHLIKLQTFNEIIVTSTSKFRVKCRKTIVQFKDGRITISGEKYYVFSLVHYLELEYKDEDVTKVGKMISIRIVDSWNYMDNKIQILHEASK